MFSLPLILTRLVCLFHNPNHSNLLMAWISYNHTSCLHAPSFLVCPSLLVPILLASWYLHAFIVSVFIRLLVLTSVPSGHAPSGVNELPFSWCLVSTCLRPPTLLSVCMPEACWCPQASWCLGLCLLLFPRLTPPHIYTPLASAIVASWVINALLLVLRSL